MHESEKSKWSRSVVSDSSRPHGLHPTRLLRPWDFPGKSTGVGCHCLLIFSKLMKAYCERQGLSMRQIRFRFDRQPINEKDTPAVGEGRWRYNWCISSRQEVSTKKGTCYFTPELCSSRPRRHSQIESYNLVPAHADYYSIVSLFFRFPFPHSFIVHKVTGVCAQAYCIF